MNKKAQLQGGGTEGDEWMPCSAKVMTEAKKQWRLLSGSKVFTSIQGAIDSLA